MVTKNPFATIDEYIEMCPQDVQNILEKIRQIIHKTAPEVTETISYGMPAFKLGGKGLMGLAAWKHHVAIYPIPAGTEAFQKELSPFVGGKGTIKFPLDQPIPYDLVEKIVTFRMKEKLGYR